MEPKILCRNCRFFSLGWMHPNGALVEPRCTHLSAAITHSAGFASTSEMRGSTVNGLCGPNAFLFESKAEEPSSWTERHSGLVVIMVLLAVLGIGASIGVAWESRSALNTECR
jgi:hypothetical protein